MMGDGIREEQVARSKQEIRKEILKVRDGLGRQERHRGDILLAERILGHQWFYRGEYLLGFVSYGSEIDTREILREALRQRKKVYVPKVITGEASSKMRFYRIGALEELAEGYRGILEPSGDSEEYSCGADEAARTLMLMPGAAFDRSRNRIGYGKGFYDAFLAEHEELQQRTVAVGYRCQLVEELPISGTDIKPCQVICV